MAIIAMRRGLMESRRTRNMKAGEVRIANERGIEHSRGARRTRRLVNATVYLRPQTNGHHQRRTAPKALRAAPNALKALQGDPPGPRNREIHS